MKWIAAFLAVPYPSPNWRHFCRLLFRVQCMCVGASDGQEAVDLILNSGEDFDIVLMVCFLYTCKMEEVIQPFLVAVWLSEPSPCSVTT